MAIWRIQGVTPLDTFIEADYVEYNASVGNLIVLSNGEVPNRKQVAVFASAPGVLVYKIDSERNREQARGRIS